eukprot:4876720-Karenia_brevis.AAC.1
METRSGLGVRHWSRTTEQWYILMEPVCTTRTPDFAGQVWVYIGAMGIIETCLLHWRGLCKQINEQSCTQCFMLSLTTRKQLISTQTVHTCLRAAPKN